MWLTENPWPPMIIAAIVALIYLGMWNSNRRGLHLVLALFFALLCGLIYPLERLIVTEGERLQQQVRQLCFDFRDKKDVIHYVSDSRPDFKKLFEEAQAMIAVQKDLRLSDFETRMSDDGTRGTVHFRANATVVVFGNEVGYQPARLILTLLREKGEWKIIDIERLNPLNGQRMETLSQSPG